MSTGRFFTAVGIAAVVAGGTLWWITQPPREAVAVRVPAGVLWSAAFQDGAGAPHTLGEFQGRIVVVNFWATWCAPCREEMPVLSRLHERWRARGVTFVGLSEEDAGKAARFAESLDVRYPVWTGAAAGELSRRLGNTASVLPHTVLLDRDGALLAVRVGPYTEAELDGILFRITSINR